MIKNIDKERFESKFLKKKINDCWEWQFGKSSFGHGHFCHNGKNHYAHRISYELYKGEIPKGLCVLHSCDNPPCVNPKHLFLGTKKDNTQDMIKKGRRYSTVGEDHGLSKLTEREVLEIREKYIRCKHNRDKNCYPSTKLAKEYGVHSSLIRAIIARKTWRHI